VRAARIADDRVAALGILGGTFNPPHIGHLICAQEARDQLGLDAVVLMPVHEPPHKAIAGDPGVEHRVEMCRLAAESDPALRVSRAEADRPGPSYTVDTLRELRRVEPDAALTFIAGADVAAGLERWREPEEVLALARMAVAERDGVERDRLRERLAGLAGAERIAFFDMPRIDVSSSMLRERVAAGRPIRHLVPDAVARYIEECGLYGAPAKVGAA
jgi:nicotinate-nucleotide adenylyltransferase